MHRTLAGITFVLWMATSSTDVRATPALADTFAFRYGDGRGNEIDTYRGTLTKDLVLLRDTTIAFTLSSADLDTIYRELVRIRFFEMREPHPELPNCNETMAPYTTIDLVARLGSKTRSLNWSTEQPCIGRVEGDWRGLHELQALIWRIIRRQPQYQALPDAHGGYL